MKNVKVIFTDTDYELVAKAYKQYDKLTENYQFKSAVLELLSLITIVSGFFVMFIVFSFLFCKSLSYIIFLFLSLSKRCELFIL